MPMNVQPIAGVSDRINEIRLLTAEIVNKEILPVDPIRQDKMKRLLPPWS